MKWESDVLAVYRLAVWPWDVDFYFLILRQRLVKIISKILSAPKTLWEFRGPTQEMEWGSLLHLVTGTPVPVFLCQGSESSKSRWGRMKLFPKRMPPESVRNNDPVLALQQRFSNSTIFLSSRILSPNEILHKAQIVKRHAISIRVALVWWNWGWRGKGWNVPSTHLRPPTAFRGPFYSVRETPWWSSD